MYADYHSNTPTVIPKLTISSSLFKWNYNYFRIGGGGGLRIILTQIKFPVDINVASTLFENNISPDGGGACILVCFTKESVRALSI